MTSRYEMTLARAELERNEKWDQFYDIPRFTPKPDWQIQLVPPFGGAIARMWVFLGDVRVSVYFDGHDRLGSVGSPYWEIYPATDGDTDRFLAHETAEMVEAIDASLRERATK